LTQALGGQWAHLGWVAAKAALLFIVAVVGLRLSARRTLDELSVFDFVTAVAVGAVVGRVPNASDTSFVAGAVTLAVLLVLHRVLGVLRVRGGLGRLFDHRPFVLVQRGTVDVSALRQAQLTSEDLASLLRMRGVTDLADAGFVVLEPGGGVSVLGDQPNGDLIDAVVGRRRHNSEQSPEKALVRPGATR
jgi:uncharacterized membrane protein YcaP (DUF421 family)